MSQATFSLRGHNPDVLTCIANLSNDEVFTPPEFANRMLDTLEAAWAESHGGAVIWEDPAVTFLDPFTKSGVFLREIVTRLTDGLTGYIPDLADRVDHILTKQVYGIGITELTGLLARRSLYCSKYANGGHSVAKSFTTEDGNIWFERTEHTWAGGTRLVRLHPTTAKEIEVIEGGRCTYCGAPRQLFDRDEGLETHAYAFIHTDDIKARIANLFGADMQFDVVIGNPPYQMTGGAGGSSDASIYHLFVEQAQRLEPRYLTMVIPSRWMAGGRGMNEFRRSMLNDGHLTDLVDWPLSKGAFPGVEIKGGVCYFLWDMTHKGRARFSTHRDSMSVLPVERDLGEFDVFVRDSVAAQVLRKVLAFSERSITEVLTADTPFGIPTNFAGFELNPGGDDVQLWYAPRTGHRATGIVRRDSISKNRHLIDRWKVLISEAYNGGDAVPHQILGRPFVVEPPSACTQTYMAFWTESEDEAESLRSYVCTKFFRFIVSLRKITQHAIRSTYTWVPIQTWDQIWVDAELYAKYGLTDDEIAYIESAIKPMEPVGE